MDEDLGGPEAEDPRRLRLLSDGDPQRATAEEAGW
jgi:hypothetical protein